ncbi:MAG: hypothetical protein LBH00_07740 [Planctomycetaceae bacterium]|jgi:hypothetical protein|nr:hypothetical protein [Planctomycetaceae bacterium]
MMTPNETSNDSDSQQAQRCKRNRRLWNCCSGCGCGVPLLFFAIIFCLYLSLYFFWKDSAEHSPTLHVLGFPVSGVQAANQSYYHTWLHQHGEFDITQEEFFKIFNDNWYRGKPVDIEKRTDKDGFEIPGEDDKVIRVNMSFHPYPYFIRRYNGMKQEHKDCLYLTDEQHCKIDPTGRTDASCFRLVSHGYYYEQRFSNGGGVYMLYDTDNHRCYYRGNHH